MPIVRACFAAIRLRARKLGARVKTEVYEDGAYICFNANAYVLDILLERLRRDLPTIAEATPSERSPRPGAGQPTVWSRSSTDTAA